MDGIKRGRRPVRRQVTTLYNELDRMLNVDPLDKVLIEAKLQLLLENNEFLKELDNKVMDLLMETQEGTQDSDAEEETGCQEYVKIQEYQEKVKIIQIKVEKILTPERSSRPAGSSVSFSSTATRFQRNYKLPKIELKKFNGELTEWLTWWSQFQKIDEDQALHTADKFHYLVQSMVPGSRPHKVVSGYPCTSENYPKVVEALKERFGDKVLLSEVYVRKLLKLVNSNTKNDLADLNDELESNLMSLESLGIVTNDSAVFLYPMVESSLPKEILKFWQRSPLSGYDDESNDKTVAERLKALRKFLKQEVKGAERLKFVVEGVEGKKEKRKYHSSQDDTPTSASLVSTNQSNGCIFCEKSNHNSADCYTAKKMTLEEKRGKVKQANACFICIKKGHPAKMCKSKVSCNSCNKKHLTLMCPGEGNKKNSPPDPVRNVTDELQSLRVEQSASHTNHSTTNEVTLLKTLHVTVMGSNGKSERVRMLIDEGSQKSYVKSSLAEKLECPIQGLITIQNSMFEGRKTEIKTRNIYKTTLQGLDKKAKKSLNFVGSDVICVGIPTVSQGPWISQLAKKNIYLTDTSSDSSEIDVLIGSDYRESVMTGKRVGLGDGLYAVESIFGWTLSGEVAVQVNHSYAMTSILMLTHEERSLPELWKLETLGIRDSAEKISEEEYEIQVKKKLQETLTREEDGRYVVNLPWITTQHGLPNNRAIAEKRLITATSKLKQRDEYERYDKVFMDWQAEGIIEEVHEDSDQQHFLPHRPVFKPESTTTPVRPVFDASCKVGRNPSLNQCLEKGPNMLELIPSILLRFRQRKVGVISDIRKAFQMVGVANEDKNFQKFLWWKDCEQKRVKVYRHSRVVFGMNCSPFILAAVLEHHLTHVPEEVGDTAGTLLNSLYVDNSVVSLNSKEDYLEFKEKAINLMADAKMELRQWESNVYKSWEHAKSNVLGLLWDKEMDSLSCQVPKYQAIEKVTKRIVLSLVSQVFDPIGFTSPATLQAKMMLQDSWAVEVGWDEKWGDQNTKRFLTWYEELEELNRIKIPRYIYGDGSRKVQLHTFCDASKGAYAAVVYIRTATENDVSIQLVAAKSRLAPLDKKKKKTVTINRLELMSCLIGSRLAKAVKDSLSWNEVPSYFWSDSSNALAWIRRNEDWGTFVGNRAKEINRNTRVEEWRHVPGIVNPADLPSRGCTPSQLLKSSWWEGPSWLEGKEDQWPKGDEIPNENEVYQELKKSSNVQTTIQIAQPRFSTYLKNVRVAAFVCRYISNLKKKTNRSQEKYLTMKEMREGERCLLLQIQKQNYPVIPKISTLSIERKEDGLLHIKTRLIHKVDTDEFREPVLLPKDDPVVHQLIEHIHRSNCHAGTQFVLGKLRERYWIPCGRKTVGKVIRKCVTCKRFSSKSQTCEPAPLPQSRIEIQFAFQTTGVDIAGPLILKGGKKAWIVLYTCAVYRGVYLDVVDSLSSEEFLDSLEKFVNLNGRPSRIYSDNGTNFVGAQNLIKVLKWKKLEESLQVKQINWTFNPPVAAWWGGFWERLVRSMKDLLRRMLGKAKLTRKELEKCLLAVSHTINNRPLTTLTEDGGDLIPLTPNMFMKDLPVSGLPERDQVGSRDLRERYQKIVNLKRALRDRFRKEYLANLVQSKPKKEIEPLEVGDVVLVGSDNKKRYEWPLGKVEELIFGNDGVIRVAKVKTSNGILTRPLQRLYPLEVSKSITLKVPEKLKQVKIQEPQPDPIVIKTRSERKVQKPSRYGMWNN